MLNITQAYPVKTGTLVSEKLNRSQLIGTIIVTEFVSIDNVFEDPGGSEKFKYGGWSLQFSDEQSGKYKLDEIMEADVLMLGRKTYEGFAEAWPGRNDEMGFADKMNSMKKIVVSSSLKKADWNNTEVLSGDIVNRIKGLKLSTDDQMLVAGSGKLVRFLLEHGLADELRLMVHPVVLGRGKKLFEGSPKTALCLDDVVRFDSGTVVMVYKKAGSTN